MKKCPYCAAVIYDDAVVCQFCHHELPITGPDTQKARKKRRRRILAVVLILSVSILAVFALIASGAFGLAGKVRSLYNQAVQNNVQPAEYEVPIQGYTIEYIVSSTGSKCRLTYANEQGGTVQETASTGKPWTKKISRQWGSFVYVWAQSEGDADVSINCQIVVNGQKWRDTSASGVNAAVTCSGRLGEP